MEQKRKVEIIIAIVFVALLVSISVLVVGISNQGQRTTITNSYNTYNYNTFNQVQVPASSPTIYYPSRNILYENYYQITSKNNIYLDYDNSGSISRQTSILGTSIYNYKVNVKNNAYIGGYFKVTFYFTDHYGQKTSYPITKYIPARSDSDFVFKDITNQYKYSTWSYSIDSMTKVPN